MNTKHKLDKLKSDNLPRLDWHALFRVEQPLPEAEIKALSDYFRQFLPPDTTHKCVMCKCSLINPEGSMMNLLMPGTFRWGLVNGEGACSKCGYPARAYHRNVGPLKFLNMVMQYHPEELV